jgi:Rhodopirellula transposase DDE domain
MEERTALKDRFARVAASLDERSRRLVAASEALSLGWGGISATARATGLSRDAIRRGIAELQGAPAAAPGRIRRPGGGRKQTVAIDPSLPHDLDALVEPSTRGDPESPLRWTCKSLRKLAAELREQGHRVSHQLVAELLQAAGYSLQANRKTREGGDHPDRDAQFAHIAALSAEYLASGDPVISVDAKKKELIGDFKNGGREWRPTGEPEEVRVHDFPLPELGKVTPYGVYDVGANTGWVSGGIDHDTAAFAVASIRGWWEQMGQARYGQSARLLLTADGGGSNGSRVRLWKLELQRLADETGLTISVCHYPPGTSKWNKIEHRLFSFITQNWRGQPLVSYAVILSLIAATSTATGLRVESVLDPTPYPTGRKVSDDEMARLQIERDEFHGEWNYTISPHAPEIEVIII